MVDGEERSGNHRRACLNGVPGFTGNRQKRHSQSIRFHFVFEFAVACLRVDMPDGQGQHLNIDLRRAYAEVLRLLLVGYGNAFGGNAVSHNH